MVAEEGLDHLWQRHSNCAQMLWGGLSSMGLEPLVEDPADRLCTVNTIRVMLTLSTGIPFGMGVDITGDRKSTRLNSSHSGESRMPSSA